jgi:hypothetical protein
MGIGNFKHAKTLREFSPTEHFFIVAQVHPSSPLVSL